MEAFLRAMLSRVLPEDRTFEVYPFQGKSDMLDKLEKRLRGYAKRLPNDWRIVVVVDRDNEDCRIAQGAFGRPCSARQLTHPDQVWSSPMAACQSHRDRRAGVLVFWRLEGCPGGLSTRAGYYTSQGISHPGCHLRRNLGSLRTGHAKAWILQGRIGENRGSPGDRIPC